MANLACWTLPKLKIALLLCPALQALLHHLFRSHHSTLVKPVLHRLGASSFGTARYPRNRAPANALFLYGLAGVSQLIVQFNLPLRRHCSHRRGAPAGQCVGLRVEVGHNWGSYGTIRTESMLETCTARLPLRVLAKVFFGNIFQFAKVCALRRCVIAALVIPSEVAALYFVTGPSLFLPSHAAVTVKIFTFCLSFSFFFLVLWGHLLGSMVGGDVRATHTHPPAFLVAGSRCSFFGSAPE